MCVILFVSYVFKLADFGTAHQLEPEQAFTSLHGTEEYLVKGIILHHFTLLIILFLFLLLLLLLFLLFFLLLFFLLLFLLLLHLLLLLLLLLLLFLFPASLYV